MDCIQEISDKKDLDELGEIKNLLVDLEVY